MIVVRMRAGLGNQLFQYALGRRLAIQHDVELKLDTSWYRGGNNFDVADRHFNLNHFDVAAEEASHEDLRRVFAVGPLPVPRTLVHCLNRGSEVVGVVPSEAMPRACAALLDYYWEIRDEPPSEPPGWPYSRHFCSRMLDVGSEAYLAGFWQSPKYFEDVAETIRRDLTVVDPPEGKNRTLAADIDRGTSVGVHVRRGDFVEMGAALPVAYYENAAAEIESAVDDPSYYVFSNDDEWAEANLDFEGETTYVSHNDGTTDYEDLRLLRRCDHQIIANSTFSWWGGWLNEHPEKRVLVPSVAAEREPDYYPSEWTAVDY